MIHGVTHDAEGEPLKRQVVAYKLGHGFGPSEAKNFPGQKKQMFVSVRTASGGKFGGTFVEDVDFTKELETNYGAPLTECDIILLSNDPEQIFRTELAYRTQDRANSLLCHGNGRHATRKWKMFTAPEQSAYREGSGFTGAIPPTAEFEISTCGDECPYRQARTCKPSGDLYFMFPERVQHGSVATLHTSGHESVKRLVASIHQIKNEIEPHGGSLRMLRVKLVMRPYRAKYLDDKKQDAWSQQMAYNLEFREADYRKLIPRMITESKQFAHDVGEVVDVDYEGLTDEEIAEEFHPTPEQQEAQRRDEAAQEQRQPGTRPASLQKVVEQSQQPKPETREPAPSQPKVTDEI